MTKKKSKSKRAAGTPVVPRYGELYSFGFYHDRVPANVWDTMTFDPVDPHQVALSRKWLELHARPRKTINFRNRSYGFKHNVERWCETIGPHEYISQGAFIQAAIDLGYRYVQRWAHAYFNIAPRSPGLFSWKYQLKVKAAVQRLQETRLDRDE